MRKCSDTVVDLDILVGLSAGLRCSVEAIVKSSFSFCDTLFVTAFALNHLNKVPYASQLWICGLKIVNLKHTSR